VPPTRPEWISASPLLDRAYALAEAAHRDQQRATDGRPFLDHVTEVGTLLYEAGSDEELVAAGLLHDAVERGTLTEGELRSEMGDGICEVVLTLTEDATIESFPDRKQALRDQVAAAGGAALTVFAADKLSDILGLRRGIERFGGSVEERMGTSVGSMAGHYRESVEVIESGESPAFLRELHNQLALLDDAPSPAVKRRRLSPKPRDSLAQA
jgi:hypothetical protein